MSDAVVTIVQARMGSSRFPGKMTADLAGRPVIDWVLTRCLGAARADRTVLATSEEPDDTALCEAAERLGVAVHRGPEADVLGRYAAAARRFDAQTVVRVCGDRPFVDPALIDAAVDLLAASGCTLAFDHISDGGENWPRGFGAEALSAETLFALDRDVTDPFAREHVTLALWNRRGDYDIRPVPCPATIDPGFPDLKLDLDTPDDLRRIAPLADAAGMTADTAAFLAAWRAHGSGTEA